MQFPADEELLRRMTNRDEDAFAEVYHRYGTRIYQFALHMSGSPAAAEDVTQEVFLTLIQEAARYDAQRGALVSFLYGIARNQLWRAMSQRRQCALEEEEQLRSSEDVHGDLARSETVEQVRAAVTSLPVHYREVVALCELEEMDYAEAAAVLGCSIGTVRSRLHRARGLLAEKLRSEAPEWGGLSYERSA